MKTVFKRIILLLTLLVCSRTMNAQSNSNCDVPAVLLTYYDADIKHLALKRVFDLKSPFMDSIKIPLKFQDTIQEGLAAIFNLTSVKERDSVFDHYCIHHDQSDYVFKSINVLLDKSYAWTQSWKNFTITTGIPSLDNLLSTYGFTVTSFSSLSYYAVLTTQQKINVLPLCARLQTFGGIKNAGPEPPRGYANEIIYAKTGKDRLFNFTIGYGDCQAGCLNKRTFKFKVNSNCTVDYIGVFDIINGSEALPKPVNCYITKYLQNKNIRTESIKIYPNPVNDDLFVESMPEGKIEILNLQGQLIANTVIEQTTTNVDLSNLAKGVYIIKATSGNETRIKKIIKQ